MSYHYETQVDSSEDENIDLSAWQSSNNAGTAGRPPRAPVAPMIVNDANDAGFAHQGNRNMSASRLSTAVRNEAAINDDLGVSFSQLEQSPPRGSSPIDVDIDDLLQSTRGLEGERSDRQRSSASTSSNAPAPAARRGESSSSQEVEEVDARPQSSQQSVRKEKGMLVPMISRTSLEGLDDEVEDFTKGYDVVRKILKRVTGPEGDMFYKVEFEDLHVGEVNWEDLLRIENGNEALEKFEAESAEPTPQPASRNSTAMTSTRPGRKSTRKDGFVSTVDAVPLSDDDTGPDSGSFGTKSRSRKRKQAQAQYEEADQDSDSSRDSSGSELERPRLRKRRKSKAQIQSRNLRSSNLPVYADELSDDEEEFENMPFLDSDLPGTKRQRTLIRQRNASQPEFIEDDIGFVSVKRSGTVGARQSDRTTRHRGGMQEVEENEIYRSASDDARPKAKIKAVGAREHFKTLPRNDDFRMRHTQECETCGEGGNFAQLIYCQGCTLAYHKSCLGTRTVREHLVTKVEDGNSVLQCRRCVGSAKKKDFAAPDQAKCADCREHGTACLPFRPYKTPTQEHKEREENDGEDPAYAVDDARLNKAENVLFRCIGCWRSYHFEHLPSRSDIIDIDSEVDPEQRFREYSRDWRCKDCLDMPAKVSGLIAWKPLDEDNYDPSIPVDEIEEDDKAYLVKWDGMSYFRACWMPGAWVWGVSAVATRKAFLKREGCQHPKMRTEDAIPEDYLRTDIVLDIKFTSIVDIRTEEVDKARIREVDKALIKYKGLGYEDAVWEAPPSPDDGDRWTDFVTAYHDWVLGRYVKPMKPNTLKTRLEKARTQDFAKFEKTTQPENVEGGELMKYQIDGLNWLYFKFLHQKNSILADEMGLGKTIQIIGFLATLVHDWNCFPFLVVVPNSTCPNWRREVKRWAPSLRVVAYYGSRESRELAFRHELFPENSKDLRCHVVVTSYDAAADDSCRKFFRSVQWQGLVVDEGQRLKNDKNLLYAALGALKTPFRVLLTGTPLQNNQRELFNLLHFLDDSYKPEELEQEFADLDRDKITKLHDMIRPFFLRRTKAQVLTFLPPMGQIIVPVSMTIVQKKLYRTILAKNPDLVKAIFSSETTIKQAERVGLNNILMQLRKCLCHPFVYNKSIEERNLSYSASHRNLVDASSKLQLLEILLPKLRERGHRVLIFSQFLDMLDMIEDFLEGMVLPYQRLDGSISALSKQKRIDEFNAPNSPLFAFLLSTRAGGVGINLASADTVIILDPDFNPHQDIQALSRAHRIGQNKKVLCFQLVTRASAEERIMQMGRKKLALDHVLIREMDADDADENDLVSVLRHGTKEIFEDGGEQDVTYDNIAVERLLDRSNMESSGAGAETIENQFSYARVWENGQKALQQEMVHDFEEPNVPDPSVWDKILRERERIANEEAAARADAYGRGRRARGAVDYAGDKLLPGTEGLDLTPIKDRRTKDGDETDTDFQAGASEGDDEPDDGELDELALEGDAERIAGHKKIGKHRSQTTLPPHLPTPKATPRKKPKASSEKVKNVKGARGKVKQVIPKFASVTVKKPAGVANAKATSTAKRNTVAKIAGSTNPISLMASTPKQKTKQSNIAGSPGNNAIVFNESDSMPSPNLPTSVSSSKTHDKSPPAHTTSALQ